MPNFASTLAVKMGIFPKDQPTFYTGWEVFHCLVSFGTEAAIHSEVSPVGIEQVLNRLDNWAFMTRSIIGPT